METQKLTDPDGSHRVVAAALLEDRSAYSCPREAGVVDQTLAG